MKGLLFSLLFVISLAIDCNADDMKPNNRILALVDGYSTSKKQEFVRVKLDESRYFSWSGNTIFLAIDNIEISKNQHYVVPEISELQFYDTGGALVERFSLNYRLLEHHFRELYETTIGDKDCLIISHYIPGATGWSANMIVFHVIMATETGYKHQELNTFFSYLESFVDLDGDGISEFICVNLVLDMNGNFVVPVVFSLDNEDNFSRTTSTIATVPGLMDFRKGMVSKEWSEVPESVRVRSMSSIPRAWEVPRAWEKK